MTHSVNVVVLEERTFVFCWVILYAFVQAHSSRKTSAREDVAVGQGRQTVEVRSIISRCVGSIDNKYQPVLDSLRSTPAGAFFAR